MFRRHFLIGVGAVVMSAGLLAGCGSSPTSPGPVDPPTPPTGTPPPPPPATPATLRISKVLAFGDSITYGVDSPPVMLRALDAGISQSYPFKLQSLLATRYSGQSVSVFNAGIGGKNAWEDRDRLAGMVSETHPDRANDRPESTRLSSHHRSSLPGYGTAVAHNSTVLTHAEERGSLLLSTMWHALPDDASRQHSVNK